MQERKYITPGVHEISSDEYHASQGISRSGIIEFKKSPRHFWHKYLNPNYKAKEKTSEMIFGSAFHMYILEPEKFEKEYIIIPHSDHRTNAWKKACEEALIKYPEKIILDQEDLDLIKSMKESIDNNEESQNLIYGNNYEQSIYWTDPDTGLMCKARPDIIQFNFVVDLKSTKDASYRAFQRDFYSYGYHIQIAMIREGVKHTTGRLIDSFIDLAVEKIEPFCSAIYVIDDTALQQGLEEFKTLLFEIKKCFDSNKWPCYPDRTLTLPSYATLGE